MPTRHINEINIYRSAKDMKRPQYNFNKPGKGPKKPHRKPPVPPPPWPPLDLPEPPETGWCIGADQIPN